MTLQPVSFKCPRGSEPRISAPRVPGRHDPRFWSEAEDAALCEAYPKGVDAAAMALPGRTVASIYQRADKLGLMLKRGGRSHGVKPDDAAIRAAWADADGARGDVARLALSFSVPRDWLSARLLELGLTRPHRKEPPWSAAEDDLLVRAPLHDLKRAAVYFTEHGFSRSTTAIGVRAKRRMISRRAAHETFSATEAARLIGVDSKTMTSWLIEGFCPATRRNDRRLIQQGGASWAIEPAALRRFILDHADRIDLRRVDKLPFLALISGEFNEARDLREAATPPKKGLTHAQD